MIPARPAGDEREGLARACAADSQILWRDPLLGWVLLLPLSVALMLRVLIPPITEALSENGFRLEPFYPLIMSGYLMTAPGIVGMVVGFMLLDDRDARTLSALRVTPLSIRGYLGYRLTGPLIVGTVTTLVAYPLAGLAPMPLSILFPIAAPDSPRRRFPWCLRSPLQTRSQDSPSSRS